MIGRLGRQFELLYDESNSFPGQSRHISSGIVSPNTGFHQPQLGPRSDRNLQDHPHGPTT